MSEHGDTHVDPGSDNDHAVTSETVVSAASDVLWQEVQGEVVLLELTQGRYYSLDPVGCQMWKSLLDCATVDASLQQLQAIYDIDATTLHDDLIRLVSSLHARRLVDLSS